MFWLRKKTKILNKYILPTATYEAETWVLTKKSINKLKVYQRVIKMKLLVIAPKNKI